MTENLPATVAENYGTGLEDIEDDVTAVPRIGIHHKAGTFKDLLTGEEFPTLYAVALGMAKQRVMWADSDDGPQAGAKPQCKSQDAKTGYPNMEATGEEAFPWEEAPGLDPNTASKDEYGRVILACDSCPFAEWGPKNPKSGKSKPPLCKERHTYPVFYSTRPLTGYEEGAFMETGIVAFQGSGVGPSRKYLSGFVRGKRPLYSAVTQIDLDVNKRGTVEYSVPRFKKIDDVPEEDLELFGRDLPGMMEYLKRPPRPNDDGADPVKPRMSAAQAESNVMEGQVVEEPVTAPTAPAPAARPAPSAPVSQPAPATTPAANVVNAAAAQPAAAAPAAPIDDDEELPF